MIRQLDGNIINADGTESDLNELLSEYAHIRVEPLDVPNDGRGHTVSTFVAKKKQYPLSTILKGIFSRLNDGLSVPIEKIGDEYDIGRPLDEIMAARKHHITLNGASAAEITYTKEGGYNGKIIAIMAKFFGIKAGKMIVTFADFTDQEVTITESKFALTEDDSDEVINNSAT